MTTKEILKKLQGKNETFGFICVNKILIKKIGINAALLYGELVTKSIYFEKKSRLCDGYFYCTAKDIEESTGLTYRQQNPTIKIMEEFGIIKTSKISGKSEKYFQIVTDDNTIERMLSPNDNMLNGNNQIVNGVCDKKSNLYNNIYNIYNINNNHEVNNHKVINQNNDSSFSDENEQERSKSNFSYDDLIASTLLNRFMKELYPYYLEKQHPFIKKEQFNRAYEAISVFMSEFNISSSDMEDIMRSYLSDVHSSHGKSNGNINQFVNYNTFKYHGVKLGLIPGEDIYSPY